MKNLILANLNFEIGKKNIFLKRFNIKNDFVNHVLFHWEDRHKFKKDYEYLKKFYERLLNFLSKNLNNIHKINYTNHQWRIIIGPWLWRFIGHYFDRFECLNLVKDKAFITEINTNFFNPSPYNYQNFIEIMNSKNWNYFITLEIAKALNTKKIFYIKKKINLSNEFFKKKTSKTQLNDVFSLLKNKETFIQGLGLEKLDLLKLFLKLKIAPHKIYEFEKNINFRHTNNLRKNEFFLKFRSENLFEKIISKNIYKHIPINFYEQFNEYINKAKKISFFPKKIITSQLHLNSDLFKIWITLKEYKNKKLIIIRHGGSDLVNEHFEIIHEKKISYKYLSIKTNSKKSVNCSRPFLIKKYFSNHKPKKILLVDIERPPFNDLVIGPKSNEFKKSFEGTINLSKKIISNKKMHNDLKIISYQNQGYNFYKEYKKIFKNKYLAEPNSLNEEIKDAKLIICRYPLSAYLKCLFNKPTLLYLTNDWHLNNIFLKQLPNLKKNNLFFDNEKKLLNHLNLISSNPLDWWTQKSIQKCLRSSFNFIPLINSVTNLANEIKKI